MTASPLSPMEVRARERRRWPPLLSMLLALMFSGSAVADEPVKGELNVTTDGGYVRLAFRLEEEVSATVRVTFPVMVVTFKKPIAVAVDRLNANAPDFISAVRVDPDGSSIRIALRREVKFNTIAAAERFYVDLLPATWSGVMPGLPQEVIEELIKRAREAERQLRQQRVGDKTKKVPTVRVKVASQPTFMRYVFAMPDSINVVPEQADGKLTLNFDQQIKWDLADAQAALPPTVESIESDIDADTVNVTFTLNGTPKVRTFREDRSIVVDIGRDGTQPKQAAEEGGDKPAAAKQAGAPVAGPAIDPPETVLAKDATAPDNDAAPSVKAAENAPPETPKPKTEAAPAPVASAAAAPSAPKEAKAAESKRPAADPNGPVVTTLHYSGDNLRAEFPFAVATPAAVFSRADTLWLVFDSDAKIDLAALSADTSQAIRSAVLERGADGEAIVRIKLERPRLASLAADGPAWIVTIGDVVATPSRPLVISRNIFGKNRASISIPIDGPRKIHFLTDPDVGDRLMVVTTLAPTRGFIKGQNFVELRALPSTHGVVLQPLADDIAVELGADKISITRPAGLSLSATVVGPQRASSNFRPLSFDSQLWGFDRQAKFSARQAELIGLAAAAPTAKRRQARFNLARFYLANDMSAEAKAVIEVTQAEKHGNDDITGTVLRAVADVMLERPDEALKGLSNPQVGNQLDAPIWRAIAYARQGKWPEAHEAFKAVESTLGALPIELQRMALRDALRTAIEVRDFHDADRVVNEIETIGVPPEMEASIAVLVGRLDEALGRNENALTNYRTAADSQDRRTSVQGRLREAVLRFASGDMLRKDAIYTLETLTTIWRGDETEAEGLKLLAHLYTEDGRYRDAFHVMRTALKTHPNSELTRQIQDEAAVTFDSLFLADKGDGLSPVEALGLFYDYRELTPIGRRGDEMIRRLADRLVGVDLLGQAAELLQHQVDHRLQGAARAQVATRLAVIYLMNRKSDRAIAAMKTTHMAELSNELRDQRLLLEARALSDGGRHDVALELIVNIKSHEAMRLRADILWAAKRWRETAEQIEALYGERWREFTPLSDTERFDVLRAAIGYSLGEEPIALERLREKYAAKMADGPDRHAFDVVSSPIGPEFQAVARKVANVDTLDAFLNDMRVRYPDVATPPESAATPAKPQGPASQAPAPDKAAAAAPVKPEAAASPLPPKAPAGTPLSPDKSPTGSISKRPRTSAR
jgi:tetratricopeptide (TPR) repeat protein